MGKGGTDEDPDLVALQDLLEPRREKGAKEPVASDEGASEEPARVDEAAGEPRQDAAGSLEAVNNEEALPERASMGESLPHGRAVDPPATSDEGADPGEARDAAHDGSGSPRSSERAERYLRDIDAERLPPHTTLTALEPAMGLSQRLHSDRFVSVPVRLWPRLAAVGAGAIFGFLWVLSLRSAAFGSPWPVPSSLWLLLALAGPIAYLVMQRMWPQRQLHLETSQDAQLRALEKQVGQLQKFMLGGLAGVAAGLLVLGAAFAFLPATWLLALGSLVLAGAVVVTIVAGARWNPMRLLFVQTLVLQRLESMGLGRELALDPRTAEVLLALDRLLGELPESSLRQFLSRPEAEWYLELIHDVKGGRGG